VKAWANGPGEDEFFNSKALEARNRSTNATTLHNRYVSRLQRLVILCCGWTLGVAPGFRISRRWRFVGRESFLTPSSIPFFHFPLRATFVPYSSEAHNSHLPIDRWQMSEPSVATRSLHIRQLNGESAERRAVESSPVFSQWRTPLAPSRLATLCIHFLNSFANASRASVGGPEEVSRSTTIRAANSSHSLRACLFTIRAGIGLLHSRRAPGSKCVHCRQLWRSALHFGQELSNLMFAGAFAPHAVHFEASPNAIMRGERGPSRCSVFDWGFDCGLDWDFGRCDSRSLSI